ncbi:MAG: O-antigen ligase family protein [Alphaproteobacteria bacterium]|nr:O-antigen ligase family protein [Alphaproteobacteria bacterium]
MSDLPLRGSDARHSLLLLGAIGLSLVTGVAMVLGPHPLFGLIVGLIPLAAAVALPRPFLLAALFILFSFFRLHEVFPQLMPLKLPLLLALGTLAALGWTLAFRKLRPFWDPAYTPFVVFFLLATVGIFTASNVGNSLGFWKDTYVKIGIMVFALSWSIRTKQDMAWMMRAIIVAGIAVATVALKNKAAGIGLVEGTRVTIGRDIGSMLGDPNDLSLVLLFAVGFSLGMTTTKGLGRLDRVLGASTYVLLILAILATQSRGGLLGIAAVTGVFVAQRIKSKLVLGGVGFIALMALFAVAGVDDRQSGGAHEEGIDESAMGRLHAWKAAIFMALGNPLTGVGIDNFLYNYFDYSDFWDGKNHAVHSTWFGVLGETGLLGFGVFVWMMFVLYRTIHGLSRKTASEDGMSPVLRASANGLLGGFTGFCVSGTFLTQGFTWPIYIILAVAIALRRIVDAELESRKETHS